MVRRTTRFGSSSTHGAHERAPYSTYASSTTTIVSGWLRARSTIVSGSTHVPVGFCGLQTQSSSAVVVRPDHLRARQRRRDPVQRVRRRVDRARAARPEEGCASSRIRSSAPAPTTTCSASSRTYTAAASRSSRYVPSGYSLSRAMLARERHLRHARQRRRVLVELEHGLRADAVPRCDLVDRGAHGTARIRRRRRCASRARTLTRSPPRRAAVALRRARAGRPPRRRGRPPVVGSHDLQRLEERLDPEPAVERASPPVGRTCVAPAA